MLDLKKLEQELDAALAKETPESLRKWLDEEEREEYIAYLKDVYPKIFPFDVSQYSAKVICSRLAYFEIRIEQADIQLTTNMSTNNSIVNSSISYQTAA